MSAAEMPAGAAPDAATDWHSINWREVCRKVRRLQARIVKAVQEGRWNKVKALVYLLTHSFSGRALAILRVINNRVQGLRAWTESSGTRRRPRRRPSTPCVGTAISRNRSAGCTFPRATASGAPSGFRSVVHTAPLCKGARDSGGRSPTPNGSRSLRRRTVATNGAAPAGAAPRSSRMSIGSTRGRVAPLECYPGDPIGTRRRSSRYSHSIAWPLPGPYTARPHDSQLDRPPAHQGSRS